MNERHQSCASITALLLVLGLGGCGNLTTRPGRELATRCAAGWGAPAKADGLGLRAC